jgi:tetratricopeptide (TPR) repeat protein
MKRFYPVLIGTLLLAAMIILTGCPSKELTSAKVYIQQDEWDKAEVQLKQAVAFNPKDAEAYFLLGKAYGRKNLYADMAKEFQNSLAIVPTFKIEIDQLKESYWVKCFNDGVEKVKLADQQPDQASKMEKFHNSLVSFKNCPIIDPSRIPAYQNIAFVQRRMDSTAAAVNTYLKLISVAPKDVKSLQQLGSLYYDLKDFDKCIGIMDQIMAIEPTNIEALTQKAYAYDSKGEASKAYECYLKALEIKPNDPDIQFNLGRYFYSQKQYDKAIEQFNNVLTANPDDVETLSNIANAYLLIAEDIIKPLRSDHKFTDKKVKEIRDNANVYYSKAIPILEKAVQLRPNDSALWFNLGVAYIYLEMKDKGDAAFKKSDELKKQ